MKIDGSTLGISLPDAANQASVRPKTTNNGAPASQDSVHLSDISSQLQSLEASVNAAPGFDAAKVENLKQALNEGRFQINSGRIANNLVASTLDLLPQQKS